MNSSTVGRDGAAVRGPGRPRRSQPIPLLKEKLDVLLTLVGRNQEWLARGLGMTPPAVTGWRKQGYLPSQVVQPCCRLLGIDSDTLQTAEWSRFEAALDTHFPLGSAKRWEGLIRTTEESVPGLSLEIEAGAALKSSLRGVDYVRRSEATLTSGLPSVAVGGLIRFALDAYGVAESGFMPDAFVLCIEDRNGWKVLCPDRQRPSFIRDTDRWWLPPRDREALHVNRPVGIHCAVAIVLGAPLPKQIVGELNTGAWACDATAAWIIKESVPHKVFKRRFSVLDA